MKGISRKYWDININVKNYHQNFLCVYIYRYTYRNKHVPNIRHTVKHSVDDTGEMLQYVVHDSDQQYKSMQQPAVKYGMWYRTDRWVCGDI